jgi:TolB-like protein/Tfp pilus assembly protein PilF
MGGTHGGFFDRLRQRKLVQWALAYIAFAFALLQGVDIVANQFGWPEVLQRGLTLLLALGLLVTLLLAWYHGERGEQHIRGSELVLLAALLAVGGGLLWHFARAPGAPASASASTAPASAPSRATGQAAPPDRAVPAESIAVLPLSYDQGEAGAQAFADGLSEDLITALSQYGGLKVISRNSAFQFRDSREDSASIGRKLGVARLLEGSVRRVGHAVRVNASLVDAADGSTLWSTRYDRPFDDVFALQDDITRAVVSVLRVKLASIPGAVLQSDRPPGGDPEAWQAYLEGERIFESEGPRSYARTLDAYHRATALDPRYAVAYASIARTKVAEAAYALNGQAARALFAEARAAVDKALALDPDLAIAHRVRAFLYSVSEFDWSVADAELRRAIQLAPYDGGGKVYFGQLQAVLGDLPRAIALTRAGLVNDPRNVGYHIQLLWNLVSAGQQADAQRELAIIADLKPDFPVAMARADMALFSGDARKALADLRASPRGGAGGATEALALQVAGDRKAADAALASLLAQQDERGMPYMIAQAYALRRDPDRMFDWLERAWANRDPAINAMLGDRLLAPYRRDPRFAALCRARHVPVPGTTAGAG